MRVGKRAKQPAGPVKIVRRDSAFGAGQIFRHAAHIRIKRRQRVEYIGSEGDPLNRAHAFRYVRSDLDNRKQIRPVDAYGAVFSLVLRQDACAVRIIRSILIMGGQGILDIFDGQLVLRFQAPGNVVGFRAEISVRSIPVKGVGVQPLFDIPGPAGIVGMIGIRMAPEGKPCMEGSVQRKVQMILFHKVQEILRAHMFLLCSVRVLEIKFVDSQLIRHDHILIVRNPLCHPVMAADGLEPPDFVHILERDAVHLVGAVFLQKASETQDSLAGTSDVREYKDHKVFLTDPAGLFRLTVLGRNVFYQGICPQYSFVGCDGLGGRHSDVGFVYAAGRPDSLSRKHIWRGSVAHRIFRKRNLHL